MQLRYFYTALALLFAILYSVICLSIYPYVCYNSPDCGFAYIVSRQLFAVLADGLLAVILLTLIFVVQKGIQVRQIYLLLLIGFIILFFELVTDTLDEIILFPLWHSIIFENVFQLIGCILIGMGIIKWVQLYEEKNVSLAMLAKIDSLTKVGNRRSFLERFAVEQSRAKRYQLPLSLMVVDINKFKEINDTYGHLCGDQVLIKVAEVIGKNIRVGDCFCRWGGDEFVILLIHTSLGKARIVRNKLQHVIEKEELNYKGKNIFFDVSIGVSDLRSDDDLDDLMFRSDSDMYNIKREKYLSEFIDR